MSRYGAIEDGWDDDELEGFDDVDDGHLDPSTAKSAHAPPRPPPSQTAAPARNHIYWQLKRYLEVLPYLPASINALLETEHNSNPKKAFELVRYYQERPGLIDYTLEKELPRMEYLWICPDTGEPIQEKARIAELLMHEAYNRPHNDAILPRCANQSLLADLLEFLSDSTHEDALIRRQFHMAAQTQRVQFILEPDAGTVLVKATLTLTLPHPKKGMIPLATLHASCQFVPHVPLWHYHLESISIHPSVQGVAWNDEELLQISNFLQELSSNDDDDDEGEEFRDNQEISSGDSLRDAFLQRTAMDMWNQLKQSSRTLSTHFSLPSDDLLEQARREEEEAQAAALAVQQEHLQRLQQEQQQLNHQQQQENAPPPPPSQPYTNNHPPYQNPLPHGQPLGQQQPQERPRSILGGMFSRIAQSVTALPYEDESMYDEWRQPASPQTQQEWPGRPHPRVAPLPSPLLAPPSPAAHRNQPPEMTHSNDKTGISQVHQVDMDVTVEEDDTPDCPSPGANIGKVSSGGATPEPENDDEDGWDNDDDDLLLLEDDDDEKDKISARQRDGKESDDAVAQAANAVGRKKTEPASIPPPPPLPTKPEIPRDQLSVPVSKTTTRNNVASVPSEAPPSKASSLAGQQSRVSAPSDASSPPPNPELALDAKGPTQAPLRPFFPPREEVDDGWVYDPETDIIPTRKRWQNPRPGPRQLARIG